MSRRVVTSVRADVDIAQAVAHYVAEVSETVALDFVDALQATTEVIADHPSIGSSRYAIDSGIPELRGLTMRGFPYVVLYSSDSDAVRIHRMLHLRRDIPSHLTD